jgi:SAM-dependent methyltransferase
MPERGIDVSTVDIEHEPLPYTAGFFDVIIINQVIEHIKEIFFVFSEISRVVKTNGLVVVGVPNLAAWHDRLAILLGEQPTCLKTLGPHVRGFTVPSFRKFIECDGYFKFSAFKGSGFYPFPAVCSRMLSRLFPSLATSVFSIFDEPQNPVTLLMC